MAGTLTKTRPRPLKLSRRRMDRTDRIQSSAIRQIFASIHNRMHYVPPLQDSRALVERVRSWVYICLEANATAVSTTTLRLYGNDKKKTNGYRTKAIDPERLRYIKAVNPTATDESVEIEDHPVLDVLSRPTPLLDGCNLLWLIAAYLQLFGETFLYKGRNNLGVAEIWPLPNQYVKKILGPKSVIDFYEYRMGGRMETFPSEDVCLIRKPSPVDMIAALGPLKAMLQAVETQKRYFEWQGAIFQNFCIPDTLLIPEDDSVTGDQIDALVAQWEKDHGGWRQRGGVDFMPFKMRVEQLGMNMRELQGEQQQKALRDEIMAGFGVPPTIATTEGATFANMKQGTQLWYRKTIGPYLRTIAHGLNRTLLPEFMEAKQTGRPSVFLAFDDPTPEDEAADTEIRIKRVRGGLLTVNQGLEQEGRLPVEGGDETLIEAGLQKLTDPTQAELAMRQQETDGIWRTEDHKREDVREEYQHRQDTAQAEQEREAIETRERQVVEGVDAGPGLEPPTFNELTLAAERLSHIGDLDGTNIMREAMAQRLGVSIPPLTELQAAPSAADVEPDGNPRDDAPKSDGDDDEKKPPKPKPGEKPDDEKKPPRDKKPKPGGKAGDRGGEHGDGTDGRFDHVHVSGWDQSDIFRGRVGCNGLEAAIRRPGECPVESAVAKCVDDILRKLSLAEVDQPDKSFEAVLQKLFRAMEREVKGKLSLMTKAAYEHCDSKMVKQVVGGVELFDEDEWIKKFADAAYPFIVEPFEAGAEAGFRDLERLGFELPFGKPETREELESLRISPETAQEQALKLVDTFSSKVVEITGEDLAEAIIDGMDEGENLDQITKRVATMYDGKVDVASKRIARTEVNNAANAGAAAQWKEAGVRKHRWLASSDACEFCAVLNGKEVDIGTPFAKLGDHIRGKDGGSFRVTYRDVLHPGLHPNDRCTIIPIVEVPR